MNEVQNITSQPEEREINIFRLLQILWKRAWIIVAITMVFGIVAYLYSALMIAPIYRSYFTAYVNNYGEGTDGNVTTTSSDLTVSTKLTYLYESIIVSRSVLEDAAELCGVDYSYKTLQSIVSTSVDANSALITVYVSDTDPVRVTQLAKAIAEVAPGHVARIRDGSSMRILDAPVQPTQKSAPSNTNNAIKGALIGAVLSIAFVIAVDFINDKVRDAKELEYRHGIIVIGVIPDLNAADAAGNYGYRYAKESEKK